MPKIAILPPSEAQKIAAGEVIERPASIVKELVENSLDANATAITVLIADGGKQMIRVVDNGCGMDDTDARLCFARHATSKISSVDQLSACTTLGFRGEALASIASVSTITLVTKQDDMLEGITITMQPDGLITQGVVPATTGTDITINNLFDAVPARKKFLKTRETEIRHITQLLHAYTLAYLPVHFKLVSDDRVLLNCPPTADYTVRWSQLLDHATAYHMVPLATPDDGKIIVSGAISTAQLMRYDRTSMYLFVNKRWINNQGLARALLRGYAGLLPSNRFPIACLAVQVDPSTIDVNVHPRKQEIKFMHERAVEAAVERAVKAALETQTSRHLTTEHYPRTTAGAYTASPFARVPITTYQFMHTPHADHPQSSTYAQSVQTPLMPGSSYEHPYVVTQPAITHSLFAPLQPSAPSSQQQVITDVPHRIIGQYHATYIVLEAGNGLYIVDQHAAHERVLYNLFAQQQAPLDAIALTFPLVITLAPADLLTIEPYLSLLTDHGIQAERFGAQQLIINACPILLKTIDFQELISNMILWVAEQASICNDTMRTVLLDKLHAQLACKAAVKAGDVLTQEAMEQLIINLNRTDNRFSCPHGRPTGWLLPLADLERIFRRT